MDSFRCHKEAVLQNHYARFIQNAVVARAVSQIQTNSGQFVFFENLVSVSLYSANLLSQPVSFLLCFEHIDYWELIASKEGNRPSSCHLICRVPYQQVDATPSNINLLFEEVVYYGAREMREGSVAQRADVVGGVEKLGESLHTIGRAFDRPHTSIHCLLAHHGGIVPAVRRRSVLALTVVGLLSHLLRSRGPWQSPSSLLIPVWHPCWGSVFSGISSIWCSNRA